MTEEEKRNEVLDNQVEDTATDYISAINELKANSVDRAKYEQLRADNKRLLDSIVNGRVIDTPVAKPEVNIQELRNNLFAKEGQSNLEYISNALKLREAIIAKGEPDPFLPCGTKTLPTEEDVSTANRVAAVMQECVDYAEGDSAVFTNELMRRTVDTGIFKKKK